jgi:hypothetical protein
MMQAMLNKISGQVLREDFDYNMGADSYFIKVCDNVGVKMFSSQLMRDRNHARFVEYNQIAPKVGAKFETKYNNRIMYGFFVEVVEVCNTMCAAQQSQTNQELHRCISVYGYKTRCMNDLHSGNIGRTFDGRSVVLDFSRFIDSDGFCYVNLAGYGQARINRYWKRIHVYEDKGIWELV